MNFSFTNGGKPDSLPVQQVSFSPLLPLPPPTAALLQPQTALGDRDGSLSKLHLSSLASAESKEPLGATFGALALLTSELTIKNFGQKQTLVPLAWLRGRKSFDLEGLKVGLVIDNYAYHLLSSYYVPGTMHSFLKVFFF